MARSARKWIASTEGSRCLTEQLLDVKGSLRLLHRFWRTLAVIALLGAALGVIYQVLRPAGYQATSLVLLPAAQSGSATASTKATPGNDITTDGRIATSSAVLLPAGQSVDRSLSLEALQKQVTTFDAATGVLGITATSSTAHDAVALADAVANRLVAFVTTNGLTESSSELTSLQGQSNQLNRQISDVQAELGAAKQRLTADASTPQTASQLALVGTLTTELSTLTLRLDSVKSQISQVKVRQISANEGTEVIQHAVSASSHWLRSSLIKVGAGALAGLLIGSVVILVWYRRDPRPMTRDELAEALGTPVLLSLAVSARRSTKDWIAFLQRYQVGAAEQWSVRRTLRELRVSDGGESNLVLLTFAGDPAGVTQAAQVALAAVTSGLRTSFAVIADDDSMEGLRAACMQFDGNESGGRPGLEVHVGVPPDRDVMPDLTVTAIVLDTDSPQLSAVRPRGDTVLSVSAGFASNEQLARVAILASGNGEILQGIFVANPVPGDRTHGRFPDSRTTTILASQPRVIGARPVGLSGRDR